MNVHYGDVLIKYGSILDVESDEIPYIAAGKENKKQCYLSDGDVIIADTAEDETVGKCTEIINTQNAKIEAGLHTIPCHPRTAYAPMFLGYYMNSPYYHKQLIPLMQGVKVLSVSKSNIGNTLISAPVSYSEQEKIVELLHLLDCRMRKQQEVIDNLKKYKRGVMQSIFRHSSQEGWTTVKLGEIFKKASRRNSDGNIKNVITNSAEYGLIPQRDFFDKDIAVEGNTSNYYVIEEGDFVYNPRKSNTAPYGPFNRYTLKEKGIISPLYTCLVLQADINPTYLAWYFKSDAWYRYIYDNGSQGVRHDRVSMTDDLLMGIPVSVPIASKQQYIANALDAVENRLSAALTEYDMMIKLRNGFMQQLFI